jgi:type IV secretory pathway VirB2 component (pilin)
MGADSDSTTGRRWMAPLFLALAILQLAPVWAVRYLPTVDGPSHVYNSWIFRELMMHRGGLIARYFQIDWRPHPNWIGTAVMAVLMTVVPPIIAEKLFVSAIVLLFALAVWMYAGLLDERARVYAFLALPFTYNWLLQAGFYNFSLGVALCFITIAAWWRRKFAAVAALLVLCYFAHPMAVGIAIAAIGLMWLMTSRDWRQLLAVVPVAPLLFWYARQQAAPVIGSKESTASQLFTTLAGARIAYTFDRWQMIPGTALVIVIAALIVVTLIRRRLERPAMPLAILTALLFLGYFLTPDNAAGGLFLRERLSLFIYLAPLAWISADFPESWRARFVAVMAALVVLNIGYLTVEYWQTAHPIGSYIRAFDRARPDSTFLAVVNANLPAGGSVSTLTHAADYAAIERRLVDVNNYEPDTGYFPTAFRRGLSRSNVIINPRESNAGTWSEHVDYVVTYALPGDDPVARGMRRYYHPIRVSDAAWLSERSGPGSPEHETMILLPIAGTTSETGAPTGIRLRVDQTMRNGGATPVRVVVSSCALTPTCDFDLGPGRSVALAGEPGKPQYIVVEVAQGSAKQLEFSTIVRRTDDPAAWTPLSVPAVNESEFVRGRVVIPDVPTDAGMNLRVWFFGRVIPPHFRVRAVSPTGRPLGEKVYALWPMGYATNGSLRDDFPSLHGDPATFIIEPAGPTPDDIRIWALITTTDYRAGKTTLSLPR